MNMFNDLSEIKNEILRLFDISAHRAAPISVSVTLGHMSAEHCKSYNSGGLVHW